MIEKVKKIPLTISINKEIDELIKKLTLKTIEIEDKKIIIKKSKNEIYNRAIEYAIEHINEWL